MKIYLYKSFSLTKPTNLIRYIFLHSFDDLPLTEVDKSEWWNTWLPVFHDYPNISKTSYGINGENNVLYYKFLEIIKNTCL